MAKKTRRSTGTTIPKAIIDAKLRAVDALVAGLKTISDAGGGYEEACQVVRRFVEEHSAPKGGQEKDHRQLIYFGDGADFNNLMDHDAKVAWPAYFPLLVSKVEEEAVHGLLRFLPWFVLGGIEKASRRPTLLIELEQRRDAYLVERPATPSKGGAVPGQRKTINTQGQEAAAQKKTSKRGRPKGNDPSADRRIAEAWQTKQYSKYADLERALNLPRGHAQRAIDRHRKRERRAGDAPE